MMDGLGDILQKLRERYPQLGLRIGEAQALDRWEIVVGPAIARHTRVIRVEKGVLWIEVDHAIWKSELLHRKRQILDLLNADRAAVTPGKEVIEDLLFLDPRGR